MRQYTHQRTRTLTLIGAASLLALAACGKSGDDQNVAAADSALNRDLALAGADSLATPKLQDVPDQAPPPPPEPAPRPTTTPKVTPKPAPPKVVTPAPAPTPAPKPTSGTVAAGTALQFATNSKTCTNTNAVGDKFTAKLAADVEGTNGATIPAGATGTFEVTEAKTAKNSGDTTFMAIRLLSVTFDGNSYPVDATITSSSMQRVRSASKGTDAKKVLGGAAIGAIIGQVAGKNTKGTVVGAAAGAAAGTAAAAATADFDTCIESGSAIAVRLNDAATVKIASN